MTVVPSKSKLRDQWPFGLVLLIVVIGLALIAMYYWRRGTSLIGGALLVAAALRLLLPDSKAGLLAVRKRRVDILLYGGFGLMILYISASIIGGPLN
ncbi:DUF3017 domain-containing protein [Kibdelosporangium aridum]|uniref:DUF3017 domain-containing protein n=1 Tax=Kibdelosporangium aridum TaxID=2030 RepID=A0A1W2CST9_KIBAR|nr:DUF3017 domain-containing protein [Kibdelosporangium aridum]SMC88281.1 Protein of unknown function [Kibdelosporangium aridum]